MGYGQRSAEKQEEDNNLYLYSFLIFNLFKEVLFLMTIYYSRTHI